jgi:hypothetical protein
MVRINRLIFIIYFIGVAAFAGNAYAATITARTCSAADVQSAINASTNGDIVQVPAGACTWDSKVSITGKTLTLSGNGIGSTIITDNASGNAALGVQCSSNNFVRVTGFTWTKSANHTDGILQIGGPQDQVGFRLDRCEFTLGSSGSRGVGVFDVYGLIDQNIFSVTGSGSIQSIQVIGDVTYFGQNNPWKRPLSLGTNKAVYIENNTFTYSYQAEDSIDAYRGARVVIRYNRFNNISIGFHGTDSGFARSTHSFEVYNNTFTNNSTTNLRYMTIRGGTGVVYDNVYSGSKGWYGITLMNYRSCQAESNWGACDETKKLLYSNNDLAVCTSGTNCTVKWCSNARDTTCTSDSECPGGTCSSYFDGSEAGGYPCRDQVGRTTNQVLSPLYIWNNGTEGVGTWNCAKTASDIQLNRDYYLGVTKPGYTAYQYPYTLEGSTAPAPATPTGIKVVQ